LRSWVAFLIVAVLAIGCYLNALGGPFLYGSHRDIASNSILREPHRLSEVFTTSFLDNGKERGLYRPIAGLSYWIDHRLFGTDPFGFHLENLLWHMTVALLVLVLLRELWPSEPLMAFGAAALFALHPVHTEAVVWVSGRSELLAAFWGLLAFLAHRRADREGANASLWRIAALAAWLVALGAKEMAATVPLLLLMTDALLDSPSGWWRPGRLAARYSPYAVLGVAYVALRWSVLGHFGVTRAHQAFYEAPLSVRVATMLKVFAAYVGRLLLPVNLNLDWDVPLSRGLTDGPMPLLALALLLTLLGLAWAVRRTAQPVAWGILWSGLALLPVSNLVPIGELGAERFLYTSSVGACAALAWVLTRGIKKPLKEAPSRVPMVLAGALGCAVLVLFAVSTIERNRDWSDDIVLYEKTVRQSPKSARAHRNVAFVLKRNGRYAEAELHFHQALTIREKALGPDHPQVATVLKNLAMLYYVQDRYADAEPLFKRALAIREKALGPDHRYVATVLKNLAKLYYAQDRYADAEPLFKRALAIREKALGPDHRHVATVLKNLAKLYYVQDRYADAEPLFKRALGIWEKNLGPDHPDVAAGLENYAALLRKTDRASEAAKMEARAKRIRASQ
jgi:tetratricopeptide (TPR) repeat protein